MTAHHHLKRITPDQERLADEVIANVVGHLARQGIDGKALEQSATETARALHAGFIAFGRLPETDSSPRGSGAEMRCKYQEPRPCCCQSCH